MNIGSYINEKFFSRPRLFSRGEEAARKTMGKATTATTSLVSPGFIRTACPHCGTPLRHRADAEQTTAECPACGKPVPIRGNQSEATPEIIESSTLYRMVAPGRFAPVPKETDAEKLARCLWSRRTIVAVAAAAFLFVGLFPPWLRTLDVAGNHTQTDGGCSFILSPPSPLRPFGIQLDTTRLLIEWSCVVVTASAAWYLCGAGSARRDQKAS